MSQIGLHLDSWRRNSLIGVVSGLLAVGLQWFVGQLFPAGMKLNKNESHTEESTAYYLLSNVPGVFAQELWISFCLVTLKQTGHSNVVSVMLTAIVFAGVHLHYRLGGAIAKVPYGVTSACLFLWQGSLLPTCLFHFIGNMGSFYWSRRAFR